MCFLCGNAQNTVDTHTRIFDKSFKSLRVSVVGNDYAPPVIKLGGVDKIKIEFDQLSPEMQYMRYSVVHCDAGWRPSQLVESEYVGGFNEANVENYDFSSATFAHYVHYNITVPNEDMDFLISGRKAYFEHDRKLIFPAGNEFRRFEMTTTNYAGMGIDGYSYHDPYYHVALKLDEPRVFGDYLYDRTQYGRFTIRQSDAYDSDTEADYMVVHFALRMPELNGGKMYVDGEFTQHGFETANMMHYNNNTQCYELDLMLKQGAYNYQYLWVPDGTEVGQTSTVEGDFYQTVNEYLVKVYNRKRGERYDRLIGSGIIYSGQ